MQELRQLVDARLAEEAADARDALVPGPRQDGPGLPLGVLPSSSGSSRSRARARRGRRAAGGSRPGPESPGRRGARRGDRENGERCERDAGREVDEPAAARRPRPDAPRASTGVSGRSPRLRVATCEATTSARPGRSQSSKPPEALRSTSEANASRSRGLPEARTTSVAPRSAPGRLPVRHRRRRRRPPTRAAGSRAPLPPREPPRRGGRPRPPRGRGPTRRPGGESRLHRGRGRAPGAPQATRDEEERRRSAAGRGSGGRTRRREGAPSGPRRRGGRPSP